MVIICRSVRGRLTLMDGEVLARMSSAFAFRCCFALVYCTVFVSCVCSSYLRFCLSFFWGALVIYIAHFVGVGH